MTSNAVCGSSPRSCTTSPSTSAAPNRRPVAASTSGSAETCCANAGSRPPDIIVPESTTRSPVNPSSTAASSEARVEAASIAMNPTRPTPIINADAVAAVRFGLRIAFSRASSPEMPRTSGNGAPMNRLSGSATVRPSTDTPKKTSSAPSPTGGSGLSAPPNRPPSSAITPSRTMPTPTPMRSVDP